MKEAGPTDNVLKDREDQFSIDDNGRIMEQVIQRTIFHILHDKKRLLPRVDDGAHHRDDAWVSEPAKNSHLGDELFLESAIILPPIGFAGFVAEPSFEGNLLR